MACRSLTGSHSLCRVAIFLEFFDLARRILLHSLWECDVTFPEGMHVCQQHATSTRIFFSSLHLSTSALRCGEGVLIITEQTAKVFRRVRRYSTFKMLISTVPSALMTTDWPVTSVLDENLSTKLHSVSIAHHRSRRVHHRVLKLLNCGFIFIRQSNQRSNLCTHTVLFRH